MDDATDVLMAEMSHRFCNSLQIICSASNALLSNADDLRSDLVEQFQQRIASLAVVHRILAYPGQCDGTKLIEQCRRLCDALVASQGCPAPTVSLRAMPISLSAGQQRLMLMLLSELVLNALKHGIIDAAHGLRVRIEILTPDHVRVRVRNFVGHERDCFRPGMACRLAAMLGGVLAIRSGSNCEVEVTFPRVPH